MENLMMNVKNKKSQYSSTGREEGMKHKNYLNIPESIALDYMPKYTIEKFKKLHVFVINI